MNEVLIPVWIPITAAFLLIAVMIGIVVRVDKVRRKEEARRLMEERVTMRMAAERAERVRRQNIAPKKQTPIGISHPPIKDLPIKEMRRSNRTPVIPVSKPVTRERRLPGKTFRETDRTDFSAAAMNSSLLGGLFYADNASSNDDPSTTNHSSPSSSYDSSPSSSYDGGSSSSDSGSFSGGDSGSF